LEKGLKRRQFQLNRQGRQDRQEEAGESACVFLLGVLGDLGGSIFS
jgi:hypothetical protein